MAESTFAQKLATQIGKLNDAQRQAVETIEGPVLVLAGPGTGKTQVLTLRIANILAETDVEPRAILAMTFTDAAAKNMQQRLATLIGESAYKIHFSTFHAFCQQVITEFPEAFPFRARSESLNDLERFELVEELLQRLPLQKLKTVRSEFHYFKEIQSGISELKREAVTPERLQELVLTERKEFERTKEELSVVKQRAAEEKIQKMEDMAVIYEAYQAELLVRRRFDYDDMISEVARAFAGNPDLVLTYQERYQYFLVDEYQDTNAAQNQVVDQLAAYWGEQANLFVVGDPHQSIYRFQGASLENTVSFVERYTQATVIRLNIGYRCPPALYQTAAALISHNPLPQTTESTSAFSQVLKELAQPLEAHQKSKELIELTDYPHQVSESYHVATKIRQLLEQKVMPSQIAILYRDHSDAAELELWFQKLHIPAQSDIGQSIWLLPQIQQLLLLVSVCQQIANGQETPQLYSLLTAPWWRLNSVMLLAVARVAGSAKRTFQEQLLRPYSEIENAFPSGLLTKSDFELLTGTFNKFLEWVKRLSQETVANWFISVIGDSGLIKWTTEQPEQVEILRQIATFERLLLSLQKAKPELTISELLLNLQTMQSHNIRLSTSAWQVDSGFVTLSTVHSAKGKEWDHVFVIGLQDKKWGNSSARKKVPLPESILQHAELDIEDRDSDDRRLLYVALTRARQRLYLSYANAEQTVTKLKPLQPSLFIGELPPSLVTKVTVESVKPEEEISILQLQIAPAKMSTGELVTKQRAFFTHLVSQFRLSATALNRYLESPELFIQENLVSLPKPTTGTQAYGIAVHSALEFLYRVNQHQHEWPPFAAVQQVFDQKLADQNITTAEKMRFTEHGHIQLRYYYNFATELPLTPNVLALEKKVTLPAGIFGPLPLVGKIDRIDQIEGELKHVTVTDYKTGADRSLNVIAGAVGTEDYSPREIALPISIRGRLKRQLLFYKLLIDNDPFSQHMVSHGIFEFVNEANGKVKSRQVALNDEDMVEFKKLVEQVSQEIVDLSFL